ncbi:MAG: transposase, partial [Proteobacteria bacterium]|nr:transposase [Pseudomonadota bacterium]
MSERFRQFQALFPEEACLAALMRLRHGGTSMACPACGRPAQFEPRPKLRGFACQHCHYMIHPATGTPLESRRTPLQLWFYALKTMSEPSGKAAAGMIAREASVPQMTAQRLVDDLTALAGRGDAGWLETLRSLVTGKGEVAAAPVSASPPPPRPSSAPVAPSPARQAVAEPPRPAPA